ncbi:MAG TPA: hypothetical protein RMF84_01495 [Polyangiaceae bacterium LLY-WYZ-14_1]|nr:hypothetical protein [Polyangiaceae bacterium LLY-WYZ-14_1]
MIAGLALAMVGVVGCARGVYVPSSQGRAYVARAGLFSQNVYHCVVTTEGPICYEVQED